MPAASVLDCAIVGGGVSGLYAGWRLASAPDARVRADSPPATCVFELTDRTGGRLHTAPVAGSSAKVELGAMRFWKAQQLLTSLLEQFHIDVEPFPSDDLKAAYVRGAYLRAADFATPANVPFRLAGAEVGKSPIDLLLHAMQQVVPNVLALTDEEWDAFQARPDIRDRGFWNLLASVLSNEGYQLLWTASGIESAYTNWNAGEAMQLMTRIINAFIAGGLFRPKRGWSELPDTLRARYERAGGSVSLHRRLLTITHTTDEQGPLFELGFATPDDAAIVERRRARTVLLALPKRPLELLMNNLPAGAPRLESLLDAVDAIPAFRLYFGYDAPWWTADYGEHGYAVTDLPLRQVFYGMGLAGSDADNDRVLMASYADYVPSLFWSPLARYSRSFWVEVHRQHTGVSTAAVSERSGQAHDALVDQALQQLRQMHGRPGIPRPTWSTFKDWGAPPAGGAWHAWRAGISVRDFVPLLRQPLPPLPLFVCGEAYSAMQGWVEGALTSTEKVLQSAPFGLSRPDWLSPDYDLGP